MKRGLGLLAVAVLCGLLLAPAAHARPPGGELRRYRFAAPSLNGERRPVRVYLPPSYAWPDSAAKRYPVVFLLHGWPGGDGDWPGKGHAAQTLDSLIASGAIPEVIAVMPNGAGAGLIGRSFYLDSYDGRSRVAEYVVHDVVDWVDHEFRTRPDAAHRALIGLSEGAIGAVNLCFQHPERFGACGGHSGEYELRGGVGMFAVWGSGAVADSVRRANRPALYAASIASTVREQVIYLDGGLQDGALEQGRTLHRALEAAGIPHVWNEFPGAHHWRYWRSHLRESLIACTARMW
jgi:enterochelin esterase-like enzyme